MDGRRLLSTLVAAAILWMSVPWSLQAVPLREETKEKDLREPAGRFKLSPNLGGREDWFTPVDGFVPSLDFGAAIFDHALYNHAFIAGHVSVRTWTPA